MKNPTNIAFLIFKESTHELGNHYDTFKIEKSIYEGKIRSQPNVNENITIDNKIKIMIWNTRSLNDFTKKIFLPDIISNNTPDIIVLANFFVKNYKTYKL